MSDSNIKTVYDVIIAGGGAAGISASLWCAELNLNALLLEQAAELGGQLLQTYNPIKNHLGVETRNGRELRDIFARQIKERDFTIKLSSKIIKANLEKKTIRLETNEIFSAKAIIIATGVRRRKLNIEGEEKFQSRGILESGKRDQNSVRGKKAAVIGGGDAAFENALILAETASQVTLIHRNQNFRARPEFIEQARNNPKVEILPEAIAEEIIGNEKVQSIKIKNLITNKSNILPIEAVLIRIGVVPNTELFRGQIDVNEKGYIKVNRNCETNIPGVFAVGDATNPVSPTISAAVGTGATAAKAISARLSF